MGRECGQSLRVFWTTGGSPEMRRAFSQRWGKSCSSTEVEKSAPPASRPVKKLCFREPEVEDTSETSARCTTKKRSEDVGTAKNAICGDVKAVGRGSDHKSKLVHTVGLQRSFSLEDINLEVGCQL